ncbi:hypothetical protein LJR045_000872 [Microbacterium sp. LjRoot45]|uniref:hypothetical protein n=1 Tax=Microbacterium sp. LjRoot45 TaxID=3342329 RepID=UPI003ED085C7
MTPRTPLTSSLPTSFSVAQATAAGVPRGRLRTRTLDRPFHGVRSRRIGESAGLVALCHAYAPRLRDGQFFSHETALLLHGAPMPEWPYMPALHVSAHRPLREPRTRGVAGHRLQGRGSAMQNLAGLPVEDPVRAWRQCGSLWQVGDLVAAADFLLTGSRPPVTVAELRGEVERMGDVRNGILSRALDDVRAGVRSARETRLRLLLRDAGLPEPQTAWNLYDERGTFIAELDLGYPEFGVGIEYDGRVHAQDARQFARDADRWDAVRALGVDLVRILSHHLDGDGVAAVEKVRAALARAGARPLH